MAARGTAEKQFVINKILETFAGSFQIDKEVRIPIKSEDGEEIQIKCSFTAAKDNIPSPNGTTIEATFIPDGTSVNTPPTNAETPKVVAPSAEELKKVDDFLERLGIL